MVMAAMILLLGGCAGRITGGKVSWACEGRYCPPETAQAESQLGDPMLAAEMSAEELAARLQR